MLREISAEEIARTVRDLCIEANRRLPADVERAVIQAAGQETLPLAREILEDLKENIRAAEELRLPVCQDTGMAVVFADLGQEVHITGGLLSEAVNRGVAEGYTGGLLRCSVVEDPLRRVNTGDNTPAVLHLRLVEGDRLTLTVAPKGFGSENMSRLQMFTPAADRDTILDFIRETARLAGSNPCPPMVLGVGIGGDFELCALLAKRALCRPLDVSSTDPWYAALERDALELVNRLDVGPQGFGGRTTALSVAVETYPTHIAGLPVAVNVGCHVTRHASAVL
ncbi:MAG: fumarate hydratase [Clostridiales bacterium]|nr:fumarate hydratase [Clostridiales bacterium]